MNKRIKELRKDLGLTQEQFSKKIGIKRNTLANYEIGRNEPIDGIVFSICREFDVNEEWLRTGKGEKFAPPLESELAKQAAILLKKGDPLFEAFIKYYLLLDTDGRETILKIAKDFSNHFAAELKAKESGEH